MRNQLALRLGLGLLVMVATSCGSKPPETITVQGKSLVIAETDYGSADYFCDPLANGQYMVIITDFGLCAETKMNGDAGVTNRQLFHQVSNANLRMIFPSKNLLKVPPTNSFKVGKSDCMFNTASGTEAVAYFSQQINDASSYDTNLSADSGTITVQYPGTSNTTSTITGTYDLTFGSEKITGTYTAQYCAAIGPGFAN